MENGWVKLMWDHIIAIDHHVSHNRPDLVLLIKEERACLIIDLAVLKKRIYEYKKKRLQKITVVLIIISAMASVLQNLHQMLKTLDLRAGLHMEFQKAGIPAT